MESETVVRIQRIKFSSLKSAVKHRLKGINVEGEETISSVIEHLKKFETADGRRILRKNASVVEFVISYPVEKSKEELLSDLHRFLSIVEAVSGVKGGNLSEVRKDLLVGDNLVVFFHNKRSHSHMHILIVPRNPTGKKIKFSPPLYKEIVKRFLPPSLYRRVKREKPIGAYPLWLYRILEQRHGENFSRSFLSLCRKQKILPSQVISIVLQNKEKSFFPSPDVTSINRS